MTTGAEEVGLENSERLAAQLMAVAAHYGGKLVPTLQKLITSEWLH